MVVKLGGTIRPVVVVQDDHATAGEFGDHVHEVAQHNVRTVAAVDVGEVDLAGLAPEGGLKSYGRVVPDQLDAGPVGLRVLPPAPLCVHHAVVVVQLRHAVQPAEAVYAVQQAGGVGQHVLHEPACRPPLQHAYLQTANHGAAHEWRQVLLEHGHRSGCPVYGERAAHDRTTIVVSATALMPGRDSAPFCARARLLSLAWSSCTMSRTSPP